MTPDDDARPIRLLLIDDETAFTTVMAKRLGKRDIRTTVANSGMDAIELVKKESFDAALLDLKMEGMDGLEVLKVLQKMAPEMPVIMLTGHGSHMAAEEGVKHGAYKYLPKPYGFEELTEIIREAVASAKPGDGPPLQSE